MNCAREYKDVANYAQSFLDELGLLPKESYRMGVNSIERFTMDVLNNSIKDREIIEYIVTFRRMLDGKDIMTADDEGIIVKLNKEGVSDLHYLWRDMDVLKNEEPKESLSLDTILSSYKKMTEWEELQMHKTMSLKGFTMWTKRAHIWLFRLPRTTIIVTRY